MTRTRLILAIILLFGCTGCKQDSRAERARDLTRQANRLLAQSTKLTNQWTTEYQKAFTVENRAKFPGNRDSLRAHADKIIAILDENSGLSRQMAEKYEEASKLSSSDQERRGTALIAEALRNDIEINNLLKSQMRLVSDENIKDGKTLTDKIQSSWQVIHQKQRESGELLDQGKRLFGVK